MVTVCVIMYIVAILVYGPCHYKEWNVYPRVFALLDRSRSLHSSVRPIQQMAAKLPWKLHGQKYLIHASVVLVSYSPKCQSVIAFFEITESSPFHIQYNSKINFRYTSFLTLQSRTVNSRWNIHKKLTGISQRLNREVRFWKRHIYKTT